MEEQTKTTVDPDDADLDAAIKDVTGEKPPDTTKPADDSQATPSEKSASGSTEPSEGEAPDKQPEERILGKYKSLEEVEKAFKDLQSESDKRNAELQQLQKQMSDVQKVDNALSKLYEVMATSDDPKEIRKALYETQKASGQFALDPSKVGGPVASEITREVNSLVTSLRSEISELKRMIAGNANEEYMAQIEKDYPFSSAIQEKAADINRRHASGELTDDQLVLEYARIGYNAGLNAKGVTDAGTKGEGTDAAPSAGKVAKDKKPKTAEELAQEEVDKTFEIGLKGPVTYSHSH